VIVDVLLAVQIVVGVIIVSVQERIILVLAVVIRKNLQVIVEVEAAS